MGQELKVTIDGLSDAIQEILEEYVDKDVEPIIEKNLDKQVNSTKRELKEKSPDSGQARKKKYKDSWTHKTEKGRLTNKKIVYNKQGQLTHLLEHGHFKFNQHGGPYGAGRTTAIPHIKPAEEKANKELLENITRDLENL